MSMPKKPCPRCGKDVSTHHLSWSNHVEKGKGCPAFDHAVDKVVTEPSVEENPVETATVDAPPVEAAVPETTKVDTDPKLASLIAKAQAREAEMLQAPQLITGLDATDPFEECRRLYAPETFDVRGPRGEMIRRAERTAYFGERGNEEYDIQKGYVPVVNPNTGAHVLGPGGMPLYTLSRKIKDKWQEAQSAASRAKVDMAERHISIDDNVGEGESDLTNTTIEKAETVRGDGTVLIK